MLTDAMGSIVPIVARYWASRRTNSWLDRQRLAPLKGS